MKTNQILFLLLVFSFFSCKKDSDAEFKEQIIGEWKFIKTADSTKPKDISQMWPPMPGKNIDGFEFFKNGNCDNKLGYISVDESQGYENRKINYLGNNTKYKIENDILKIFNVATKKWESIKIISITKDTLTLQHRDSMYDKYAKTNYKIDPKEQYDQIIVSSSGCYGSCPVINISLNKNGNVLYQGLYSATNMGMFRSKITKREFLQIENRFKRASINKLDTDYSATHTDDEEISVTFIKNNRIYKTISDYGHEAPAEFQWAYRPVIFLDQKLKLQPHRGNAWNISNRIFDFETAAEICSLAQSESFFLLTELDKGEETTKKFKPKYKNEYLEDEKTLTVYTDGSYYRFPDKSSFKTIDLSYDFLERNDLYKNLKKKTE